jgi:hypothetical protein
MISSTEPDINDPVTVTEMAAETNLEGRDADACLRGGTRESSYHYSDNEVMKRTECKCALSGTEATYDSRTGKLRTS